jgi:hypothetical protein
MLQVKIVGPPANLENWIVGLLDVQHGLVHFQGFRNRLSSLWANPAPPETVLQQEAVRKAN